MTDHPLPAVAKSTGKPDKRRGIKPAMREAITLMTWGDDAGKVLDMAAAAKAAGVTTRGLRKAMDQPAVIALMRQERTAARAALTCSVPARLHSLAHQDVNRNAAVAACRALEALPDDAQAAGGVTRTGGMQVVVIQQGGGAVQIGGDMPMMAPSSSPMLDVTPTADDEQALDLEPDDPHGERAEHFASMGRPDPYRPAAPPPVMLEDVVRPYAAPSSLASAPPWPPLPPRSTRSMRRG